MVFKSKTLGGTPLGVHDKTHRNKIWEETYLNDYKLFGIFISLSFIKIHFSLSHILFIKIVQINT